MQILFLESSLGLLKLTIKKIYNIHSQNLKESKQFKWKSFSEALGNQITNYFANLKKRLA